MMLLWKASGPTPAWTSAGAPRRGVRRSGLGADRAALDGSGGGDEKLVAEGGPDRGEAGRGRVGLLEFQGQRSVGGAAADPGAPTRDEPVFA